MNIEPVLWFVMEQTQLLIMRSEFLTVVLLKIQVCCAVKLKFLTFQRIQCLQNTGIYSQSDAASHPRGLESAATDI
jgi:hypothetical protein